jgi:hypothetical protein
MLQAALEALDRSELARLAVGREGMTTTTKTTGAVHLHPLLKVEKESRQQFLRAWEALGLNWSGEIDGWPIG